jgi:hypothetical protein
MAALSRRLTAPGVGASMRTPSGPNVSAALFPELTSETSAAQWGQGHRVELSPNFGDGLKDQAAAWA